MSNKQSSVEWLIEQVINNNGVNKSTFQQAKAMHKQEIVKAWDNGAIDATYGNKFSSSETYYNETFGGNNEQQ
jgi:TRAP-type uncharacterized transport system substrate-binding protein